MEAVLDAVIAAGIVPNDTFDPVLSALAAQISAFAETGRGRLGVWHGMTLVGYWEGTSHQFYAEPDWGHFLLPVVESVGVNPDPYEMIEGSRYDPDPNCYTDPDRSGGASEGGGGFEDEGAACRGKPEDTGPTVKGNSGATHSIGDADSGATRETTSSGGTDYGGDTSEEDAEYEEGEQARAKATEEDDEEVPDDPPEDEYEEEEGDNEGGGDDPGSSIYYDNEVLNVWGREEALALAESIGVDDVLAFVRQSVFEPEDTWSDGQLALRFVVAVRTLYV